MKTRILIVVVLIAFCVVPAFSHHSVLASHDSSRVVTIKGSVAKIEWRNPHAWITLNVKQPDGNVVVERVEIAGPGGLTKAGFDRSYVNVGDLVTIEAWLPKVDPRFTGLDPNGRTLTLADGRSFDVADKWPAR